MTIINKNRKQSGATLVEVMLVIVIAAFILFLSIRQYQSFRTDADSQQLSYNVDTLFQAMAQYYKANCYGTMGAGGVVQAGTLNPDGNSNLLNNSSFSVDITTDLLNNSFLAPKAIPLNPLVNTGGSSSPYAGYITQFNWSTTQSTTQPSRYICTSSNGTSCTSIAAMATILIWKAQVAVSLKTNLNAKAYLNILGGDCLSKLASDGKTVMPCNQSNNTGTYVVWERLPSFASPNSTSDYWTMNPTVQQFTQMYSTYPIVYSLNAQGTIPGPGNSGTSPQYIYCGS